MANFYTKSEAESPPINQCESLPEMRGGGPKTLLGALSRPSTLANNSLAPTSYRPVTLSLSCCAEEGRKSQEEGPMSQEPQGLSLLDRQHQSPFNWCINAPAPSAFRQGDSALCPHGCFILLSYCFGAVSLLCDHGARPCKYLFSPVGTMLPCVEEEVLVCSCGVLWVVH